MRFAPDRARLLLGCAVVLVLIGLALGRFDRQERALAQAPLPLAPLAPAIAIPGPTPLGDATLPPEVSARAAAVVDFDSGLVLYDKNAYQPLPPASLTKILTALVTLQHVDPRTRVIARFSPEELDPDSTVMGLSLGEELTVEDLLYGLMLPSGNDAAVVLANVVGGSQASFAALMNRFASANGLSATTFVNAHGLHDSAHRTSAYDIAQIARLAMRDPRFQQIVRAPSWTVRGSRTYTVANKNAFLAAYRGADGVKIGWTEEAGATIVASAARDGRRVLVALFDTGDRVSESRALMDWAFAGFRWPGVPIAAVSSSP
jgi:D-alanyl-D-alanine carboxypeptidase